jgi:hypothetical protein
MTTRGWPGVTGLPFSDTNFTTVPATSASILQDGLAASGGSGRAGQRGREPTRLSKLALRDAPRNGRPGLAKKERGWSWGQ